MKRVLVLAVVFVASSLGFASGFAFKEVQISTTTSGGWLMTDNPQGLGSCTSTGFCSPVMVTISEREPGGSFRVIGIQRLLFQTGPVHSGTLNDGAILSGPGIVTVGSYFTGVFNGPIQWKLSDDRSYYQLQGKILSTDGTNARGFFAVRVAAPLSDNGRQRIQQVSFTFKLRTQN